jgi:hypothetical protein
MANYALTNTILVWTENKDIVKFTNEIAKELRLKIWTAKSTTDLMAVPCFLQIIDSVHLKDLIINLDKEAKEYFNYNEAKILLCDKFRFVLPLNVIEAPQIISKIYLYTLTKGNLDLALREESFRKKQYKKRSWRAIYLYHLIANGEKIDMKGLAIKFDLTGNENKTITRGFDLLKEIYPTLEISYYNKDEVTVLRATRKKRVNKVTNHKEKQLKNSVARIIDLYQILERGEHISIAKYFNKYKVGDKTLSRDIQILREVNPSRIITYDKAKGYY